MASRLFTPGLRALGNASQVMRATRSFQTTARLGDAVAAAPLPARKPVGAFRGGYETPFPSPFSLEDVVISPLL